MTQTLLIVAGMGLAAGVLVGTRLPRVWFGSVLTGLAAAFAAALTVLISGAAWDARTELAFGGEAIHLRLDAISAFFLVLLAFAGGAGTIYSQEYWPERSHPRSAPAGRVWWSGLLLSLALTLVVMNGLHFLLAWELFTVCAYFLVTLERQGKEVCAAGWLYLAASHAAALALFAFFSLLAAKTGSWELGDMRARPELASLFWLALAGFGLKAGMFPLHIWLPSAHANAPTHVSAILSGVTIKMGIYGLVRFTGWLPVPNAAGWVVALLGVASAVLGVAFALGQHDLKRLLAYHSVENIGIILIGLGFAMIAQARGNASWGRLALAGALLHVWNHGLFKSLLFFAAGSVLHATGTREMSRLGGLWPSMPWTTSLFCLGAIAICGLPPLNGFVSEWLVYFGLFGAAHQHGGAAWGAIPAAILLAITGALALACFVKVCGIVFLGAPRSEAARRAHESGSAMRAAMILLAAACSLIGFAPALFWPLLAEPIASWNSEWRPVAAPVPLLSLGTFHLLLATLGAAAAVLLWRKVRQGGIARAVTWDCGYSGPEPRMQYTAGSFARIITQWFGWILRPSRHEHRPAGIFPQSAHFSEHTSETVLEKVIAPAGEIILRAAHQVRRLQHGRAQAYLLYLLIALAALAAIALGERR